MFAVAYVVFCYYDNHNVLNISNYFSDQLYPFLEQCILLAAVAWWDLFSWLIYFIQKYFLAYCMQLYCLLIRELTLLNSIKSKDLAPEQYWRCWHAFIDPANIYNEYAAYIYFISFAIFVHITLSASTGQ